MWVAFYFIIWYDFEQSDIFAKNAQNNSPTYWSIPALSVLISHIHVSIHPFQAGYRSKLAKTWRRLGNAPTMQCTIGTAGDDITGDSGSTDRTDQSAIIVTTEPKEHDEFHKCCIILDTDSNIQLSDIRSATPCTHLEQIVADKKYVSLHWMVPTSITTYEWQQNQNNIQISFPAWIVLR